MNIPQGYKQTELGIIPEDWKVVNFCEVADNFTGLTYAPENVKNYGTLVLRSSNIQDGFLCYEDNVYVDGINIPDRAKAKAGDILVCVRNGSRNLIGKSALISSKAPKNLAFGAFMTVLRAKNGSHNIFIHQIWQSDYIQRQIKDNLGATINQITNKDISRYIIPMPPIAEQRAIAEALSDVDGLIAALDKKIAKKRLLKQGAMQQLLTGKKRLSGFTDKWVEITFGEYVDIYRGGSPRPIESYITDSPNGVNWIKIGDVKPNDKYINKTEERIIPDGVSRSRRVDVGDFILSNSMSFGRPYILGIDGCIHDGWLVIQNYHNSFDKDYLYYLLCSEDVMMQYIGMAAGSSVKNLNKEKVASLQLCVPTTIEEQQAIATILSDMDKEIADLEAQRDKYRLQKSGMKQKLQTGQIRLKTE